MFVSGVPEDYGFSTLSRRRTSSFRQNPGGDSSGGWTVCSGPQALCVSSLLSGSPAPTGQSPGCGSSGVAFWAHTDMLFRLRRTGKVVGQRADQPRSQALGRVTAEGLGALPDSRDEVASEFDRGLEPLHAHVARAPQRHPAKSDGFPARLARLAAHRIPGRLQCAAQVGAPRTSFLGSLLRQSVQRGRTGATGVRDPAGLRVARLHRALSGPV